jgi:hypothetical protein
MRASPDPAGVSVRPSSTFRRCSGPRRNRRGRFDPSGKFGFVRCTTSSRADIAAASPHEPRSHAGARRRVGAGVDDLPDGHGILYSCAPPPRQRRTAACARRPVRAPSPGAGYGGPAKPDCALLTWSRSPTGSGSLAGPNGRGVVSTPVNLRADRRSVSTARADAIASQSGNFVSSFESGRCKPVSAWPRGIGGRAPRLGRRLPRLVRRRRRDGRRPRLCRRRRRRPVALRPPLGVAGRKPSRHQGRNDGRQSAGAASHTGSRRRRPHLRRHVSPGRDRRDHGRRSGGGVRDAAATAVRAPPCSRPREWGVVTRMRSAAPGLELRHSPTTCGPIDSPTPLEPQQRSTLRARRATPSPK